MKIRISPSFYYDLSKNQLKHKDCYKLTRTVYVMHVQDSNKEKVKGKRKRVWQRENSETIASFQHQYRTVPFCQIRCKRTIIGNKYNTSYHLLIRSGYFIFEGRPLASE